MRAMREVAAGHGRVWLPYSYAAKWPGVDREFAWQYLFPSSKLSTDPRDGSAADAEPQALPHPAQKCRTTSGVTPPPVRAA